MAVLKLQVVGTREKGSEFATRGWTVAGLIVLTMVAVGCVETKTTSCGDLICPEETVCVPTLGQCYSQDLVSVCQGRGDGDLCTSVDILDGHCRLGVCVETVCGDNVVSGSEECEEGQMGDSSCESLNFYGGEVTCGSDCAFDTTNCIGFCGDGVKNGPEECDAQDVPPNSCLDFGFDGGKMSCSAICSTSFETCERFGWNIKLSDTSQYIEKLWGMSEDDYYAVGRSGTFRYFNGAFWSSILLGDTSWRYIDGSGPDDVWAVGRTGGMAHKDANGWAVVEDLGVTEDLYAVHAIAPNDAWVVGEAATVLHFDGSAWTPVDVGATTLTDFKSISVNGARIAISGKDDSYDSVVYVYDGVDWTILPTVTTGPMTSVEVTDSGDIWAVAKQENAVVHWDGVLWEVFNFYDMGGDYGKCHDLLYRADNDIYVACGGNSSRRPIWHYDGDNWVRIEWNAFGTARTLVEFGDKLFGAGANGALAAFDGRGYLVQTTPEDTSVSPAVDVNMYGMSVLDRATMVTATSKGAAVWDGVSWNHTTMGFLARAPVAISKTLAYVGGASGTVQRYNGTTWQVESLPAPMDAATVVYMKASSAENVWAMASSGGRIANWDGSSWTGHTVTMPSSSRDLATFSATDTWMIGYSGGLMHWDGTSWTADTFFSDMVDSYTLYAIGGTSSTDLYIGTNHGLYHRDAIGWSLVTEMPSDDTYYQSLSVNNENDVYALITSGAPRLYHYDGSSWTLIRSRLENVSFVNAADDVVVVSDYQNIDTLVTFD